MRCAGPVAAVALLALAVAARAAAQQASPAPAQGVDALCLSVKNSWMTPQRCSAFLDKLELGIGSMTSLVQQEFVPVQGAKAVAPKYDPSIVFATWEGQYITSGANPVKEFEPITLTAVIDGVFACNKAAFTYSKLFTFRQLGLKQPLLPGTNTQGLQAMCGVTPMTQNPSPANDRLAQPWAYIWTEAKGATVDNSGLFLGCQDYGTGLKFDGVVGVTCSFTARLGAAAQGAAALTPARRAGARASKLAGGAGDAADASAGGGALVADDSAFQDGEAVVGKALGGGALDVRAAAAAAVEGALARGAAGR